MLPTENNNTNVEIFIFLIFMQKLNTIDCQNIDGLVLEKVKI